jgi:hypothetical protein
MTENNELVDAEGVKPEALEPNPTPAQPDFLESEKGRTITFFVVLTLLAAFTIFYSTSKSSTSSVVEEDVVDTATSTVTADTTTTPIANELVIVGKEEGLRWFTQPRRVADQKFVSPIESEWDVIHYYAIGTYGSSTIYLANYYYWGNSNLMFLSDDTSTRLLLNHTSPHYHEHFKFSPEVTFDNTIRFAELSPASTLEIANGQTIYSSYEAAEGKLVPVTEYGILDDNHFSRKADYSFDVIEVIGTTTEGQILRGYDVTSEGTAMYKYALTLAGGLYVEYKANLPEYVGDDRVLKVIWNDTNEMNDEMYRVDGMGSCGGGGPEAAVTKVMESDIRLVGKTNTGLNVFVISNPNHPLISRVFDATKGMFFDFSAGTGTAEENYLNREEFIELKGVVVVAEADGSQLIFTHGKYGPQAECGKPVVYVYPEVTTDVTVKVDAYVTKSEPEYNPSEGWKATAHPDGTLVVGGVEYENLFWDGYGNGLYNKPDAGVIVPTDTALEVMADNLRTIGFIETEIEDFVEFWADHLPEEEYTRITWLLTKEMEELAHLSVEPRPDTLIRAFVDYEGVTEPYEIAPQELPTFERRGYVVTEWGGLLRKN